MKIKGTGDIEGMTVIANVSPKMDHSRGMNTQRTNANLISKAPELLEALKHTLEVLYECDPPKHLVETYANLFANYNNLIQEAVTL